MPRAHVLANLANMVSRPVTIGDLRDHLSQHLRRVRRGEEIVVLDRDTPIARIVPHVAAAVAGEELAELVAEGVLRGPDATLDGPALARLPLPRLRSSGSAATPRRRTGPRRSLLEALLADRQEASD